MNLQEILEKHRGWLNNEEDGERANLSGANLSGADLSDANLRRADLRRADLSGADLSDADLSGADLRRADLRRADLSGADLSDADLSGADLSGADGLTNVIDYIKEHFETVSEGIIAYKTFGCHYSPPTNWTISPGSVIMQEVNFNRTNKCGCGVNVAPLEWVKNNDFSNDIWKCLIKWEWLVGVCVPYNTDGKIRASRVQLLEVVTR